MLRSFLRLLSTDINIRVIGNMRFVLMLALAYAALASLLISAAAASDLTVKVNREGKTVEGASICVGSRQEPALFGRLETNAEGIARFANLPNGSVSVTAVKDNLGRQAIRSNHIVGWVFIDLSTPAGSLSCKRFP